MAFPRQEYWSVLASQDPNQLPTGPRTVLRGVNWRAHPAWNLLLLSGVDVLHELGMNVGSGLPGLILRRRLWFGESYKTNPLKKCCKLLTEIILRRPWTHHHHEMWLLSLSLAVGAKAQVSYLPHFCGLLTPSLAVSILPSSCICPVLCDLWHGFSILWRDSLKCQFVGPITDWWRSQSFLERDSGAAYFMNSSGWPCAESPLGIALLHLQQSTGL